MDYCLAIDVGKGKSCYGLMKNVDVTLGIRDGMETVIRPKLFRHTAEDLAAILRAVAKYPKEEVAVVMESTGIYHLPLARSFRAGGFTVIVVNPLITGRDQPTLRKTKYDEGDVAKIANSYFKGNCNMQYIRTKEEEDAAELSREIEHSKGVLAAYKNELRQLLYKTAPAYETVYGKSSLFEKATLALIRKCPHADRIASVSEEAALDAMCRAGLPRYRESYREGFRRLRKENVSRLFSLDSDSPAVEGIEHLIDSILALKAEIREREDDLVNREKDRNEFRALESFRGIGEVLAAHISAEAGDLSRFSKPQKLTSYAGLDPSKEQSGTSLDTNGAVTKRGNRHLRKWLYVAVMSILMHPKADDREFTDYYRMKRGDKRKGGQTHHHFYAMTACCNKLIRKFYYRYLDLAKEKR